MTGGRSIRKTTSILQLYERLTENERIIVDVLRRLIKDNLPPYCKEKISYNVPFFYGHKGICIVWPASIPRGGIHEGVLLGFWHGNKLKDTSGYLTRGTNKQVYYRIFKQVDDIDPAPIIQMLITAVAFDRNSASASR